MFFLLCPRVAGEISSSLKYSIDNIKFVLQFFDDVRDVIRKAPAKELVDLPEGHHAKQGTHGNHGNHQ